MWRTLRRAGGVEWYFWPSCMLCGPTWWICPEPEPEATDRTLKRPSALQRRSWASPDCWSLMVTGGWVVFGWCQFPSVALIYPEAVLVFWLNSGCFLVRYKHHLPGFSHWLTCGTAFYCGAMLVWVKWAEFSSELWLSLRTCCDDEQSDDSLPACLLQSHIKPSLVPLRSAC